MDLDFLCLMYKAEIEVIADVKVFGRAEVQGQQRFAVLRDWAVMKRRLGKIDAAGQVVVALECSA